MTNVLLPRPPVSGIVSARSQIEAQVALGASAELAMHHLHQHACRRASTWRGHWVTHHLGCVHCDPDGPSVQVVACPTCGEPLAVVAEMVCDHFSELVETLEAGVIP